MPNSSDEISNFIDKSDKVFLLSQNDAKVSLDIPFANQYSGAIQLNIEAESPIFIRNHYVEGDDFYIHKDEKTKKEVLISKEFMHHNNTRYIPATSVKGMVRNTLEILSYGKLKGKTADKYLEDKVDENNLHRSTDFDLSEILFGTTELKGRVMFSHFKEKGFSQKMPLASEILGTPEAKKKKFGWKNYPIVDNTIKGKGGKNDKVKSQFLPLSSGTKFQGVLHFHNLRDFELGALLSALTFHNTSDAYHNIGLAKSLGYGKIKINFDYKDKEKLLQAFEEKINAELFDGKILWHKSPYIKELLKKHSKEIKEFTPLSNETAMQALHQEILVIQKGEREERNKLKKKEEAQTDFKHAIESNDEIKLKSFLDKYPNYEFIDKIQEKYDVILQEKIANKHKERDEKATAAWQLVMSKKNKFNEYQKVLSGFINKWSKEKEHKGSKFILELIEKAKQEIK